LGPPDTCVKFPTIEAAERYAKEQIRPDFSMKIVKEYEI